MKTIYIFLIILFFILIITCICYYRYQKKDSICEKYDTENIYNNFKQSLSKINKQVRKGVFEYYKANDDVKNWIMNILNNNCKVVLNSNLYYGHPDLEFNYSHTMSDKIILSNNDYNTLVDDYNNNNKDVLFGVGSTIVHESMHVDQRYNYDEYKELYKKWGYIFVDKIHNFKQILETKRQNPDADDNDVLWFNKGKYYFINCFYDRENVNARVVNRLVYTIVKENGKYVYKGEKPMSLNNLYDYNRYFGNLFNNYTPNEICAEYNEYYYKEMCLNIPITLNTVGYNVFKNWYKQYLNKI